VDQVAVDFMDGLANQQFREQQIKDFLEEQVKQLILMAVEEEELVSKVEVQVTDPDPVVAEMDYNLLLLELQRTMLAEDLLLDTQVKVL
jgi:hypothetical protein